MTDSPTLGTVLLGRSDLKVSALGYGTLPLGRTYGPIDDADAVALIRYVLDAGVNLLDTSNVYAEGHVEELVGRAIAGRRGDAVVATKFGMQGPGLGRPDRVRETVERSLRRLDTDYVDILYLHQIDPTTPIEDTVFAMGELVEEGKVRALGLSEITPSTLRRAHETFPIAVVQQEYSLLAREIETDLLPVVRELGITLVAYSPLARGLLTGTYRRPSDLPADDARRSRYPRMNGRALDRNIRAASALFRLAEELGTTPVQLALGWLYAAHSVVPIPGTRSAAHFDSLLEAPWYPQEIEVTRTLSRMFPVGIARGDRYAPEYQRRLDEAP
jgi:aryl-alcohol dehydrogenase-like predicted oxidoreductase